MYLTADLSRDKLEVKIDPATNYERVNGAYDNHPDPLTSWLTLEAGEHTIGFRLTWEQLNALHATLDVLLHDHTRYTLGHNEPAEVLADRDPTPPVIEKLTGNDRRVYNVNGNEVTFTATDDWKLCVHTVNGEPMSNRDLPDWDSYSEAVAYLETILETRPATTRS